MAWCCMYVMYECHFFVCPYPSDSIVPIYIKVPLRKRNYIIQHNVKVRETELPWDSQEQVFMTEPHKLSDCCCSGDHDDNYNDNDDNDSDDKYADTDYENFLV
jgi:hypothetical protein